MQGMPAEGERLVLRSEMDLDDRIQKLQADPKNLVVSVKERMGGDFLLMVKDKKEGAWVWSQPLQPQERTL